MSNKTLLNKNEIAYRYIKNKIINNEFKCGEIVSESSLAAELNMSRTPVREAIQALYNEKYVEIRKGLGIYIKHVTLKEMYDITAIRVVLECYAIRDYIGKVQPHQIDRLITLWNKLKVKILNCKPYDTQEIFELDVETHNYFVESSGNTVLVQMVDNLKLKIHRYQKMFTEITNNDLSTVEQHIDILQAVKAGDSNTACNLLEKHIYTPLNRLFENNKLEIY